MNVFIFTNYGKKCFEELSQNLKSRIKQKLITLKHHNDIFSVLKKLNYFNNATHRLRVGKYRIILNRVGEKEFLIVDIGHRKNIYDSHKNS